VGVDDLKLGRTGRLELLKFFIDKFFMVKEDVIIYVNIDLSCVGMIKGYTSCND
jgi:hypothetical protein